MAVRHFSPLGTSKRIAMPQMVVAASATYARSPESENRPITGTLPGRKRLKFSIGGRLLHCDGAAGSGRRADNDNGLRSSFA